MINIKLGIIYYFDDIILHNKLDYIEYIQINSIDNLKFINKPTLVIGWYLIKNKLNNINILNKQINHLHSWTFSFNEKKNDYINDLDHFVKKEILKVFDFYKYEVLSPIFNTDLESIDDYIKYFTECDINNIYISKLMQLTILCNDIIYRINLNELKYYKINPKPLLLFLNDKYNNTIFDKTSRFELTYIKYFKDLDENIIKKYIPIFNKVIVYNE